MLILMRFYQDLYWYYPLTFVVIVVVVRGLVWTAMNMFGSDLGDD
jgi:hypothetical protein